MVFFLLASLLYSALSIILVIVAIAAVVFLVIKLGGWIAKLLIGMAVNSILGFIVLLAVGYFFKITVTFTIALIAAVALFGLPAVGTILILKIIGEVPLMLPL